MRLVLAAWVCLLTLVATASAQTRPIKAPPTLPPISMTCIHHPEILETEPGTCPICKMKLVPVRLDSAWMCPVHTTVIESDQGTCHLCGRQLVRVTVSLTWACRGDDVEHLEPGVCSDGSPRIGKRALRAHGNHNPQHGGQFFMAPDNWHHLEGAYPAARSFRLYLYDDYARPLPLADMRKVEARVVTKETFDPATRETTEQTVFPLTLSRNRRYLEARVDTTSLPAEMTAKVRFAPGTPEHRFDFAFEGLTKEPAAPVRAPRPAAPQTSAAPKASSPSSTAAPTAAAAPVPSVPAPSSAGAPAAPAVSQTAPVPPSPLVPQAVPVSMSGIVAELRVRSGLVRDLVARGDFTAVWVPAFRVKDLAIALEPHLTHLSPEQRATAEPALAEIVRGAWLLDAAGDLGNRPQVEAAYAAFSSAVSQLLTAVQ